MYGIFVLVLLSYHLVSVAAQCAACSAIQSNLTSLLSPNASIVCTTSAVPRWSNYDAPNPGTVVNVATEKDVAVTVQYCNKYSYSFLAQGGGNGWSDTFHLSKCGILINLRGIRQISFDAQKKQGTVQGGALISEVVAAAYASDMRVSTGTCNCVGYMGAVLGGGLSRTMGLYGLGVDQLVSLNLVTPAGKSIQVDPTKNSDLWWAMRGAGPNFGIVTSATIHAYPVAAANNTAWTGPLIFTPDKIKAVVKAINNLDLKPKMEIDFYYTTLGPPSYTPVVIAIPFYVGTAAEGRAAFASIFAVGPTSDGTTTLPYNQWNSAGDSFCTKGGLKPAYGVSMNRMDPTTWFAIWNEFLTFLKSPGTGNSTVLVECYSTSKAQSIPSSSSAYPFRDLKYHAIVIPEYSDPSFDADAIAFAARVRNLWRSTDDVPSNSSYINFAHGDEPLLTLYGNSTTRLQALKKEYDPYKRLNQWFPLS